jgi:hypothetical protein
VWNVGADSRGVSEVAVAHGGGLKAVLGASVGLVLGGEGETTLGELRAFTLGLAEQGSRLVGGMGEQASTMIQRFLETQ